MKVHHLSKRVTGYVLAVGKGGRKFSDAAGPRGFFTARPGLISGTRVSMKEIAGALTGIVGRPVVDNTGLTGAYDLNLSWTPEEVSTEHDTSTQGPSLFTALQDQLGLRLSTGKTPVDMVIVDHAERTPAVN